MFAVQITGILTKQAEQKDTKFGKAAVYSVETKNKKGDPTYVNCIQYKQEDLLPKGSLVFVSGEMDVSQYMGKTRFNLLTRNIEVLKKATEEPHAGVINEDELDELPF